MMLSQLKPSEKVSQLVMSFPLIVEMQSSFRVFNMLFKEHFYVGYKFQQNMSCIICTFYVVASICITY